jgi:hypothetical protein
VDLYSAHYHGVIAYVIKMIFFEKFDLPEWLHRLGLCRIEVADLGSNDHEKFKVAVPEANTGIVLIPFVGAVLLFFFATALEFEGSTRTVL